MSQKLIAARDYVLKSVHQTTPTGKSETVPGESYSIRELFAKLYTGNAPAVARQGTYDEDPTFDSVDMNQLQHADLFDQEIMKNQVKNDIKQFELELKQQEADKASKIAQEQRDQKDALDYVKEQKRSQSKKQPPPGPNISDEAIAT